MKILLVLDCNIEFINGVSLSVLHLSKGLTDLGHDVRFLMPSHNRKATIEERAYLAPSFPYEKAYPDLRLSYPLPGKIRKAVIKWKPDIVHSHSEGWLFLSAVRIARKTGARHIHSYHTNYLGYYIQYAPLGERLSRVLMIAYGKIFFSKLDGRIFPSEWALSTMELFHYPEPKYIIPTGIHTEIFSADHSIKREEIRRNFVIDKEDTLLIFVGRIATEKNLSQLLSYFKYIEDDTIKLMIVGDGPMLEALKIQAMDMIKKGRIICTGMIPPEKTYAYYSCADIFVSTSLSETQGLTYVEAMASGLPVVCSYAPYIDGLVIEGETGFSTESIHEFVKKIKLLASNPKLCRTMGKKAQQHVLDEYSIITFAKRCLHAYTDV